MAIISGGNIMPGAGIGEMVQYAGTPVNPVSEVQRVTITGTPDGGTFTLTFDGWQTAPIAYNATAADVVTALNALPNVESGDWVGSGGALPGSYVVLTAAQNLAGRNLPQMTADGSLLTGGTNPAVAVTTTTPGVTPLPTGIAAGGMVQDTTNGAVYLNAGTQIFPVWSAEELGANTVATADIQDLAVTTGKIADDAVDNDKLANITRGSVKVGGTADAPTDLDAKTDGQILIGDGTDIKSVAVSGDITITNAGATAIGATKVTAAMLADAVAVLMPTVAIAVAAEDTDVVAVTITAKDAHGTTLTQVVPFTYWLSDTAGAAETGTGVSTSITATTGVLIAELTTKISGRAMTDTNGVCVLACTETGTLARYMNVAIGGHVVSSAVMNWAA